MPALLQLNQATIKFGGLTAVNAVDFTVNDGELVGIIGPNGAGKTTVFNLMTGVYQPTSGSIHFAGQPLAGLRVNEIVVMVILGGMGNTIGVILAAILLTLLPEVLRPIAEYRMIIYSLLLIVLMIMRPQGLFNFKFGKTKL